MHLLCSGIPAVAESEVILHLLDLAMERRRCPVVLGFSLPNTLLVKKLIGSHLSVEVTIDVHGGHDSKCANALFRRQ